MNSQLKNTPQFRKDLNSLRAVAVLSVMLFHFKPNWLTGGFVGVDVFFVISGYLMSAIIFTQLQQQRFKLFDFYIARANRIIPALSFLCLSLLSFAWFYLPPLDYAQLGKHVATSIAFLSNFMYFSEAGYFDHASQEKWLLHTWSLAVEWQFYLIYPLLLLLLQRFFNLRQIKKILLSLFLILFTLNLYLSQVVASFAYYLLPSRAWEMLLGAFVFLYPLQLTIKKQGYLQNIGLILILLCCVLLSSAVAWPGYAALLPVCATALLLAANLQQSWFSQSTILQALGRWSYSIYLWHWPLMVFGLYFKMDTWWIFSLPMSVLLGYLSYTYVEQYHFSRQIHWHALIRNKPLWMSISIAILGTWAYLSNGFVWHYQRQIVIASLEEKNSTPYPCLQDENQDRGYLNRCLIGNPKQITAIMVGDSHADALASGLLVAFRPQHQGIEVMTRASCPFILNAKHVYNNDTCYKENYRRLKALLQIKHTPIVITARWNAYFYGQTDPERVRKDYTGATLYFGHDKEMSQARRLKAFAENLKLTLCAFPAETPLFITQPIPEIGQHVPKAMSRLMLQNKPLNTLSISHSNYENSNRQVRQIIQHAADQCHAKVLDPAQWLCEHGQCKAYRQLRPLYYDGDHMSEYGNKFLTPMFAQIRGYSKTGL